MRGLWELGQTPEGGRRGVVRDGKVLTHLCLTQLALQPGGSEGVESEQSEQKTEGHSKILLRRGAGLAGDTGEN